MSRPLSEIKDGDLLGIIVQYADGTGFNTIVPAHEDELFGGPLDEDGDFWVLWEGKSTPLCPGTYKIVTVNGEPL